MLNLSKSTISRSVERPTAEGYTIAAEGLAMVGVIENGVFGARPSSGAAGEKFLGISLSQQLTLEYLPKVEDAVVPASGATEVVLTRVPVAGSLRIVDNTAGAVVDLATVTITGFTVTFAAGLAGHSVSVTYRYAPSVVEAKTVQGDIPPGGAAGILLGSVGVIEVGDVYTSEYDTAADWTGASPTVRLGPNGQFTTAGTGPVVNAVVVQVPTSTDAFLGIRIS